MLINRRLVLGLGAAAFAPRLWAQQSLDDPFPPLPPRFGPDTRPEFRQTTPTLGRQRPPDIDLDVARALLERAPYSCPPVDVAMYWRNIGLGTIPDLGSDRLQRQAGPHFVRGWPVYYNPVIIDFFLATSLNPREGDGDGTHWCAAFVNWCIARGGARSANLSDLRRTRERGTRSASSGSFRCWPDERDGSRTGDPQRGDIVVWATEGTVSGCSHGTGHVAFYLEPGPNGGFIVVGGNQRDPTTIVGATQSAVCRKAMPRRFNIARAGAPARYKTVHSIRTAGFLRG
jgi:hypothetical protein